MSATFQGRRSSTKSIAFYPPRQVSKPPPISRGALKGEPAAGTTIVSTSGGNAGTLAKSTGGLLYNRKAGYHLTAEDLHFPVNGEPESITLQTADAITTSFPVAPMLSRDELSDSSELEVCIPYAMDGSAGLKITGSEMTFDIPKGYEVLGVRVLDDVPKVVNKWIKPGYERPASSTWVGDHTGGTTITVTVNAAGVSKVVIPLNDPANPGAGDFRIAGPLVHLRFNPATISAIRDSETGFTTKDLAFLPKISGGKYASALPAPIARSIAQGAATAPDVPPASTEVVCAARTDTTKDGKVFVGRCAPMSVVPGSTFRYTIFVGNLSDKDLGLGYIKMRVPVGCKAKKATSYVYNGIDNLQNEVGTTHTSIQPTGKAVRISDEKGFEVTWPSPLPAGTLISWKMGSFYRSEAGVVTVEMEVDSNFKESSIQDNTCALEVANAPDKSPGPLAVVVRKGDVFTEAAKTIQGVLEGMGMQYTTKAGDIIAQDFVMGRSAATITFGAANILRLKPDTHGKSAAIVGLPSDRVFVIGHPDKVDAYNGNQEKLRVLLDEPEQDLRIVVGPGTLTKVGDVEVPDGVVLISPPGKPNGYCPANRLLNELPDVKLSVISRELASYMVGNSGNGTGVVSGTNHFGILPVPMIQPERFSSDQPKPDPKPAKDITVQVGPAQVLSHNGNAIVAAGGGNIVAGGGGNIVAGGGGNIVAGGGGNIVAGGGGNIVAGGGGNVLSHNGNAIVAGGGGNIVAGGGGNIVAGGGGNIVAGGGGNIVAGGGGNIVAGGGGNIMPR